MRCFAACSIVLVAAASVTAAEPVPALGEEQARQAALAFGQALLRADTSLLKPILPERGRLRMRLHRLGPEEGSYSACQVEALLKEFLREGSVRSFDVLRLECDGERYALVQSRARVTDGSGVAAVIDLHLTFQPEGQRWALREVRESPP